MAITRVGSPVTGLSTGSGTLSLPTGWAAGDIALVTLASRGSDVSVLDPETNPPTGYTLRVMEKVGAVSNQLSTFAFAREMDGSETNVAFPDYGQRWWITVSVWRSSTGWDATPVVEIGSATPASSTSVSIPGGTTTVAGTYVVDLLSYFYGSGTNQISAAMANGDLDSYSALFSLASSLNSGYQHYGAGGEDLTAGSVGATTATLANAPINNYSCVKVGLVPATAGGTITGSGAITATAAVASGAAARAITGSGAVATGAASVSGVAERSITGAGAITAPGPDVAGVAERVIAGSGAINATGATASGSGTVSTGAGTVTGAGNISAGSVAVSGVGKRVVTGSGAISVGAVQAAAVANRSYTAAGAITVASVRVSGAQEGQQAAPVQGGWGVREEDADEGRDRTERDRRKAEKARRKAVERAFEKLSPKVAAEIPAEVVREVAQIAAPSLRMPIGSMAEIEAAVARLETTIAAVWAEMQAEAVRRAREEEAEILLLMVA